MLNQQPSEPPNEPPFGAETPRPADDLRRYESIPPSLGGMEPGPVMAVFLSGIDVAKLSPFDTIVVLKAHDRMRSHYAAATYRDMIQVKNAVAREYYGSTEPPEADDSVDDEIAICESAAAEIRLALRLTRYAADTEMVFALDVRRRLPRLGEMLDSGQIDVRRAKVIDQSTAHLPVATAQDVLDTVSEVAGDMTTGELRTEIRRLCLEANPDEAQDRYKHAVDRRRVVTTPNDAGTANLAGYDLPPDRVTAISDFIHQTAMSLHIKGETRAMDQLRADVFLDLLTGVSPSSHAADHEGSDTGGGCFGSRGMVEIVADIETLTGLAHHPGELRGYGPVIADMTRQIVDRQQDAQWRLTSTNPDTGERIHIGTTSRRPTITQRRRIETRSPTCVFPGCRMPASQSDIDHTTAIHDGGQTCDCNLAPLCRHHHRLKHSHGWDYTQQPDGRHQWTTPTGHTYTNIIPRSPP